MGFIERVVISCFSHVCESVPEDGEVTADPDIQRQKKEGFVGFSSYLQKPLNYYFLVFTVYLLNGSIIVHNLHNFLDNDVFTG